MKKLIFILCLFIFASSAYAATVYKWVHEEGSPNLTDECSRVPPTYRDSVEEVNRWKMGPTLCEIPFEGIAVNVKSVEAAPQPPPIEQTLIREGFVATMLAEALRIGKAQSEAEAESLLASVGIMPRNGWIADYPLTPDIIGELQSTIASVVDSGRIAMTKDEAMKAFQDLIVQQGLPVGANIESQYAEVGPPPSEYPPEVINNYYYTQGPPVVTYYAPPWDYYYLYAWVPYPFWYRRVWFPGFFVLRDFHRYIIVHGRVRFISNHFGDPRTGVFGTIDPTRRHMGFGRSFVPSMGGSPFKGFSTGAGGGHR